jgi:hypothetical protein
MRATGRHLRNRVKGVYYETRSAAQSAVENISGQGEYPQTDESTLNQGATSI